MGNTMGYTQNHIEKKQSQNLLKKKQKKNRHFWKQGAKISNMLP